MTSSVLLPWIPFLAMAALGGRYLKRRQSTWLGVVCAAAWLAFIQASEFSPALRDVSSIVFLLISSATIIAIGSFFSVEARTSAHDSQTMHTDHGDDEMKATNPPGTTRPAQTSVHHKEPRKLLQFLRRFDDWIDEQAVKRRAGETGDETSTWGAFDEFLRHSLHDLCGATHIRPLRWHKEAKQLLPIGLEPSNGQAALRSENRAMAINNTGNAETNGVTGFVFTTGTPYFRGDKLESQWADD
ncbi:MAG: hypothetical protein ACPGXK_13350, partial [Phycisphaerae bacterium]